MSVTIKRLATPALLLAATVLEVVLVLAVPVVASVAKARAAAPPFNDMHRPRPELTLGAVHAATQRFRDMGIDGDQSTPLPPI
jgi:hypothetical protein